MSKLFRVSTWLGCLVALSMLSACQTLSEKRQSMRLDKALHDYELIVRWDDPRLVDGFAMAHEGRQPTPVENAGQVRVTGYEVLSGPTAIDDETVVQQVLIRYIVRDTQVQKELMDRQVWRYVPDQKTWKRISDAPRFEL